MIQIKNAAELEKMRKAAAISAAALKAGGEAIEPGITTAEIDKIIYDFIVRHGARPNFLHLYGFPATACISVNDTVIHGIPSRDQKIRPGDIVSIDTGCKIDGFNGDNACTFACGKLDLEAQRLLDVTKESLHLGIAAAQAGADGVLDEVAHEPRHLRVRERLAQRRAVFRKSRVRTDDGGQRRAKIVRNCAEQIAAQFFFFRFRADLLLPLHARGQCAGQHGDRNQRKHGDGIPRK